MADDHCDTGDEHSDEIAEEHLAQERRPSEREEWADAAQGEGHDRDEAEGETRCDEKQAVAHSLHWQTDEALPCLMRHLAKQPLDAKAQSRKNEDEHYHGSLTWDVCPDETVGPLEIVGQIGECAPQRNKMLTGRADARIDIFRDRLFLWRRLFGGFGRVLLILQPLLDLRIAEQCDKLGHLRGRRFVFARRRRPARPLVRRRSGPRQQGGRQKDRRNAGSQRSHRRPRPFGRGDHHCHGPEFPVIVRRHLDHPVRKASRGASFILTQGIIRLVCRAFRGDELSRSAQEDARLQRRARARRRVLVVSLMLLHFRQNAAQVVGLRCLQRRERSVGRQLLLPQQLADRQHVPVVQICSRWGAECTAQRHG
jgi:hypothetical protein